MRIAIGNDHAGYAYKLELASFLMGLGHEVLDCGCTSTDSVDYPDYALPVARAVSQGQADSGILICFTGIGISISANKVEGVRCALCSDTVCARLTRQHNDSNVLALGVGMIGLAMAKEIVSVWLNTGFEGGRHQKRVDKIMAIEAHH